MRLISPAKINLHLRVGPLAADGFHPLCSWMCTVGFFDTLSFRVTSGPGVALTCDRRDVPTDESNLIVRAGKLLMQTGGGSFGAAIHLEKKIPLGGGLGGGSSNAATALMGLSRLWKLNFSSRQLHELASTLGSDVPFFLHGVSSICTGRGQHVQPVDAPLARYVVLMFPEMTMPTPAVYRKFDEMKLGSDLEHQPDWKSWALADSTTLLASLVNDLEIPSFAIAPKLGELRSELEQSLGRIVRMSGSGSTLFTLAEDIEEAKRLCSAARDAGFRCEAVRLAPSSDNVVS